MWLVYEIPTRKAASKWAPQASPLGHILQQLLRRVWVIIPPTLTPTPPFLGSRGMVSACSILAPGSVQEPTHLKTKAVGISLLVDSLH